jgi:MFS family permease
VSRITRRFGLKATTMWGGALFLIAFIGPALAWSALSLGLALFACGLTIAAIEVAMNAKASQMEGALGRRIMTQCHAWWSFGTVGGALIGGAFAQAGVSFLTQQLLLQPLFAVATILCGARLIADAPRVEDPKAAGFALPSAALVLTCLIPIGALLIEGAMMEWSALLLRESLGASPFATAATFSVFALSMAVARLGGDRLAELFGPRRVIVASGLTMGAAMAGFALAPTVWAAMPLAALVGAGCANVYPLTMSLVAPLPGQAPEKNVATLALTAFTAFLIGPPFVGVTASFTGLPTALALLGILGLAPVLLRRLAPAAPARAAAQPQ